MENIYTNQRSLLEQATLQDRRKAFQFAYLNLMQKRMFKQIIKLHLIQLE